MTISWLASSFVGPCVQPPACSIIRGRIKRKSLCKLCGKQCPHPHPRPLKFGPMYSIDKLVSQDVCQTECIFTAQLRTRLRTLSGFELTLSGEPLSGTELTLIRRTLSGLTLSGLTLSVRIRINLVRRTFIRNRINPYPENLIRINLIRIILIRIISKQVCVC